MIYVIFFIATVLIDQLSKIYVLNIFKDKVTIPVITDVFHITFAKNTGAAFSIFKNNQLFLIILSIVLIAFMLGLFIKACIDKQPELLRYALLLVSAGAVGNLLDRFRLGYVVDFFDFRLINFAIFNVADVFICVGMGFIAILLVFFDLKWP